MLLGDDSRFGLLHHYRMYDQMLTYNDDDLIHNLPRTVLYVLGRLLREEVVGETAVGSKGHNC